MDETSWVRRAADEIETMQVEREGAISVDADEMAEVILRHYGTEKPSCTCPVGWGQVKSENCPRCNPRPRHTVSGA